MNKENLHTTSCIRTHSGLYINVFDPTPEMIDIRDIATGLAYECRWGNQIGCHFSVAQHSVLMAWVAPSRLKFQALMHDASEAYTGDMAKPIKARLPDFKKMEDNLMQIIADKYGFQWPISPTVKGADVQFLREEWDQFMIGKPSGIPFKPWPAERAKSEFLTAFNALCNPKHQSHE